MLHSSDAFWLALLTVVGLLLFVNTVALYCFIKRCHETGQDLPAIFHVFL